MDPKFIEARIDEIRIERDQHATQRSFHDKEQRKLGKQIADLTTDLVKAYKEAPTTSPTATAEKPKK